jgi:O-antigen/teichoic acid export membrane protein
VILQRIHNLRGYLLGRGLGPFVIRSVAGTGAVQVAGMFFTFLVGVQLARGLGVRGYGYYALAFSIVTIAGIPAQMGLSRLVTREVATSAAASDWPRLFGVLRWADRICMLSSLVIATIVVLVTFLVRSDSPLSAAVLFGAPIIPLVALARIRGGALQGLNHVVRGQIPAILLRPALVSLMLFVAHFAGRTLHARAAMGINSLAAAGVLLLANVGLGRRLPPARPAEVVRSGRPWLASSIPLALTEGMRVLQGELSILLVGLIAAPAALGLFRIANSTIAMAAAAIPIVLFVALPVIARLHAEHDRARLQRAVTAFAWLQLGGVALLSVPLLLAAEPLLRLVFGAQFVPAANVLRVLALGQIVSAAFGPNAALLNMTHHERRVMRAMSVSLVVSLVTIPLGIAAWGIVGAALASVISMLCWNVMLWSDARRLLSIDTSAFGPASLFIRGH